MENGYRSTHKGGLKEKLKAFNCKCGNYQEGLFTRSFWESPAEMKCDECGRQMIEDPNPNNPAPTVGVK